MSGLQTHGFGLDWSNLPGLTPACHRPWLLVPLARLRNTPVPVPVLATPIGVFPTVPPVDIANALKAGLLPFLERTLRDGYRELAARAGQPDRRVASVLSQALLQQREDWGWLLAYANPHQVARLMRTCAQLLRRQVQEWGADRCGLTSVPLLHLYDSCEDGFKGLPVSQGAPLSGIA